jgi:hypothetical protein
MALSRQGRRLRGPIPGWVSGLGGFILFGYAAAFAADTAGRLSAANVTYEIGGTGLANVELTSPGDHHIQLRRTAVRYQGDRRLFQAALAQQDALTWFPPDTSCRDAVSQPLTVDGRKAWVITRQLTYGPATNVHPDRAAHPGPDRYGPRTSRVPLRQHAQPVVRLPAGR